MRCRRWSIRGLLWAVACTLVLKAAVPLFAVGAAQMRGVAVGDVCPIYGVTLPGVGAHAHHQGHHAHDGHPAAPDDTPAHSHASHDHCALTGLAAMAAPVAGALPPLIGAAAAAAPSHAIDRVERADACAIWFARMQHPPPSLG